MEGFILNYLNPFNTAKLKIIPKSAIMKIKSNVTAALAALICSFTQSQQVYSQTETFNVVAVLSVQTKVE